MAYLPNTSYTIEGVFATAVNNAGTFVVDYPAGTSQAMFQNGLAGSDTYIIVDGNNRFTTIALSFGASNITVTNNTGGTFAAGSSYALNLDARDGNDVVVLTLPLPPLASIANGDVLTEWQPGIEGTIESYSFVTTTAVTTAARAATLNLEIDTTDVTGGALALTSAAATPIGRVINAAAITGANTLTRASRLSVEASSVTAFAEGAGYLLVRVRRTGNYL